MTTSLVNILRSLIAFLALCWSVFAAMITALVNFGRYVITCLALGCCVFGFFGYTDQNCFENCSESTPSVVIFSDGSRLALRASEYGPEHSYSRDRFHLGSALLRLFPKLDRNKIPGCGGLQLKFTNETRVIWTSWEHGCSKTKPSISLICFDGNGRELGQAVLSGTIRPASRNWEINAWSLPIAPEEERMVFVRIFEGSLTRTYRGGLTVGLR